MQSARVQQDLHHSLLSEKTHSVTLGDQETCLHAVLQNLHTRTVFEGAHVHPHTVETL